MMGETCIQIRQDRRVGSFVHAEGALDIATAGEFERAAAALASESAAVLDLSGVTYMDSTSLTVIVKLCKRMNADGLAVIVVSPVPVVRRIFAITGVDRLLILVDSLDHARRRIEKGDIGGERAE
jgi:anti-sigma B factor antagonist